MKRFSFPKYFPVAIHICRSRFIQDDFSRVPLLSIKMLNLIYLRNLQVSVSSPKHFKGPLFETKFNTANKRHVKKGYILG